MRSHRLLSVLLAALLAQAPAALAIGDRAAANPANTASRLAAGRTRATRAFRRPSFVGARHEQHGGRDVTHFRVWAPDHARVDLEIHHPDGSLSHTPMRAMRGGFHKLSLHGVGPGTRYKFRPAGKDSVPDPAARYQPEGVHGPSEVVAANDPQPERDWHGITQAEMHRVGIYEMHVGTFTPEGTLDAAITKLDHLAAQGHRIVELMPLASAPGERGWGYDGVNPHAVLAAYGGPAALRRFIRAAHARGIAVGVDVVLNHDGPQGNYHGALAREYTTPDAPTPWGDGINYGKPAVRQEKIQAITTLIDEGVDLIRLDATHEIRDEAAHRPAGHPQHILAEIASAAHAVAAAAGRNVVITAEDDRNLNTLLRRQDEGGTGLDGVWIDDFHHQVRVALGQPRVSYYANFTGSAHDLAKTLNAGWFYHGQRLPNSTRRRGTSPKGLDHAGMIYTHGNHDQYGNRATGDRLRANVSAAQYRAARTLVMLSPGTPLTFQGDEWGSTTPFQFFTDHDPAFGALVSKGRMNEFHEFGFDADQVPDPQARSTFENSKLRWEDHAKPEHQGMLAMDRTLNALRTRLVGEMRFTGARALSPRAVVLSWRGARGKQLRVLVNLDGALDATVPGAAGMRVSYDSEHASFGGDPATTSVDPNGRVTMRGAGAVVLERE